LCGAIAFTGVIADSIPLAFSGRVVPESHRATGCSRADHVAIGSTGEITRGVAVAFERNILGSFNRACGSARAGASARLLIARACTGALEHLDIVVAAGHRNGKRS